MILKQNVLRSGIFCTGGDDVTTWVQGPLMKNILFNSNLETNRFQLQLFPKGWRLTGQFSYFLANQLNTVPSPPVGTFSNEQIGQEASLIVEVLFQEIFMFA